jgi:hypothetical protein
MDYWRIQTGVGIPGRALWLSIGAILHGTHPFHNSIDLAFALFGLAMTVWAMRTLRPSYWLFMVLNVVVQGLDRKPVLAIHGANT